MNIIIHIAIKSTEILKSITSYNVFCINFKTFILVLISRIISRRVRGIIHSIHA
ncbi:hypothetical protein OHAE_32 [Ochrobactrum soli]|uniref:Uncharacterized protein n=1 Tax=Ochrobactrum soli TaxID=2448455 RepID=A0A2P9HJ96_9HYPH|nr:hypothetical protein OHAE_32 [[Ochrobactrum] soli]